MDTVLSSLKVMPESRAEIKKFGESLIQSIQWGDISPLELDGRLKALEELVSLVRDSEEMQTSMLNEAYKYPEKTFEQGNYKYQIKEVGVKFDFSNCDDQELEQLMIEQKRISDLVKKRQDFLKGINHETIVYDENGIRLFPPAKTSTTKVVTLLK